MIVIEILRYAQNDNIQGKHVPQPNPKLDRHDRTTYTG